MGELDYNVGIGFELHVNAHTPAFKMLLENLGRSALDVIDPETAHITIVDSVETSFPLLSVRDERALERARSTSAEYLSTIVGDGLSLAPDVHHVETLGHKNTKIGIIVADDKLLDIRATIGDIFYEEARVNLRPPKPYLPHITVAHKPKLVNRNRREGVIHFSDHKVPRQIHVDGFNINERVLEQVQVSSKKSRAKYRRSYNNIPSVMGRH